MATESDGEEETTGKLSGSQNLAVDDDSREMAKKAAWSVSSCKPGNGVPSLRDDNLETYWQSDGAQPHLVNIQFQKKVKLHLLVLYVDYKLDESYTPSKISIRAGDGFHNMKEIKTVELVKPVGWVHISLSGTDPRGFAGDSDEMDTRDSRGSIPTCEEGPRGGERLEHIWRLKGRNLWS